MKKLSSLFPKNPFWAFNDMQVLFILVLITLFLYLGALGAKTMLQAMRIGQPDPYRDQISVVGTGTIHATPDVAILNAGLDTTDPAVADAQKENTTKMNGFIAKVKTLGVADADIRTTDYSVAPKYEYQQTNLNTPAKQVLVGYTVSQTLEIKVRTFTALPSILQGIGEFGLNQVGSFQFTVDNTEAIKKQALALAIQDAEEKAVILSRESHTPLGALVSFYENTDMLPEAGGTGGGAPSYAAMQAPAPEPQSGTHDVVVSATLSYEIKK